MLQMLINIDLQGDSILDQDKSDYYSYQHLLTNINALFDRPIYYFFHDSRLK